MAARWHPPASDPSAWPELPWAEWADALEALHLYAQIVGKIRLACGPWLNHSWGVALYVTARGLTTSFVPYRGEGFEVDLDLTRLRAQIVTTAGAVEHVPFASISVAAFHDAVLAAMGAVGMPVTIHPVPSEIADATPFPDDTDERVVDPDHAVALWRALVQAHRVFTEFRAGFLGKVSPVHLFWGAFDLAVTRFSGRPAPPHPGGLPNFPDAVAREAYSHEVTSLGFWPGNRESPTPIFYAYAYPMPGGFADASVEPDEAFWLDALGEFALPYDAVQAADDPDAALLAFARSTHAAAADLAGWDRSALESSDPHPATWWHRNG
ncbi:MAG TPA: DUF5996 family protein [Euzebyales bacterium]